jgi:hypothetical protein
MSNVDPVAVAKRWLDNYRRAHVADGGVTVDVNEAIALARAVIAASELADAYRPPSTHAIHRQPCDCALCVYQAKRVVFDAALRGEDGKP